MLNKISQKTEPFEFNMELLESNEGKTVFANVLEDIKCNFDGLLKIN